MEQEYKLNDFYHAVILKTVGFQLLRLEKSNGRFLIFVFADPSSEAQATIQKYWDRDLKVEPRELIDTINELKTRIHSGI